ncbi:MAG: putative mycofactocin-associated electron transfer flavoprotein [Candidatus Microthrix parvicella]|nr:putative mycofactocin-associated electron transfer flavoprotein [Candidatus Microthrix parvicella]
MSATTTSAAPGVVVAALKWADLFVDVDPLTGEASADRRARGLSAADEAALELALTLGEALGRRVVAITVGGPDAAVGLRGALAVGADRAVLATPANGAEAHSLGVARALAWALDAASLLHPVVVCGDYSADRGSGSVPAALAALAGLPQALGLVQVDVAVNGGGDPAISVQRRLDGARREELLVRPPAVLSVEGAVARLRRAPLSGTLAGGAAAVETLTVPADVFAAVPPRGMGEVGPAVPRTKVMPSPVGDAALARLEQLTDTQSVAAPAQALVVSPEEAARHLLEAWAASGGTVPEGVVGDGVVADGVVGGATSENTASDGPEGR